MWYMIPKRQLAYEITSQKCFIAYTPTVHAVCAKQVLSSSLSRAWAITFKIQSHLHNASVVADSTMFC